MSRKMVSQLLAFIIRTLFNDRGSNDYLINMENVIKGYKPARSSRSMARIKLSNI